MSNFSETYEDYMRMPASTIRRRIRKLKKHYEDQQKQSTSPLNRQGKG